MSGHHGRDQIQDITLTARRDGTFTGLDVHILSNMGAYLRLITPGIPLLGAFMFNGSYKFDAYRFVCDGVFTTKTPTDAYRGAGRPEATFAIERIVDEMAVELAWTHGAAAQELDRARRLPVYDDLRHHVRQRQLRRKPLTKHSRSWGGTTCAANRPIESHEGTRSGSAWASRLHRVVRLGAVPTARRAGLRGRRVGPRLGPSPADRQGRGRHRNEPARSGA
jgi:hypothetical protein